MLGQRKVQRGGSGKKSGNIQGLSGDVGPACLGLKSLSLSAIGRVFGGLLASNTNQFLAHGLSPLLACLKHGLCWSFPKRRKGIIL